MYQHPTDTLNPAILLKEIIKRAPRFRGYRQQDSQELLRYLQDICRSEFAVAQTGSDQKLQKQEVEEEQEVQKQGEQGEQEMQKQGEEEDEEEEEEEVQQEEEEAQEEEEEEQVQQEQTHQQQHLWIPRVPEPRNMNNIIDKSFGMLLCSSVLCHHCGNVC